MTGTAEIGATVTVTIGTKKYTATADTKGSYKVTIPKQPAGKKLTVTATDKAGNASKTAKERQHFKCYCPGCSKEYQ